MKAFFENLRSDKILYFGFLAASFFILSNLVYTVVSYPDLAPFIPLFNQMPWGVGQIGTKWQIFIPTLIAFLIFIVNSIVSFLLYKTTPLISRILSITAVLVCFFALLFVIRTIQLII